MEQQIREERLSDEEREWRRRFREEQAELTREARRRLGLPEEDSHD
jgi:predicted solute-binding protein